MWVGVGVLAALIWIGAEISGHLIVAAWISAGIVVGVSVAYPAYVRQQRKVTDALSSGDSTSEPFPAPMSYRVDVARQLIASLPPHIREFNLWAVKTMLERTPGRKRKDPRLEPMVFYQLEPAFEELVKQGELERMENQHWRIVKKRQ